MKKILAVLMMAFLLIAIPIVLADEETNEEVSVMDTEDGAAVRLLQLQRSIERNIVQGESVMTDIIEDNPDTDVVRLEEIIAELEVLSSEIDEKVSYIGELNETEAAESFVIVKEEAMSLIREFKNLARSKVRSEAQEQIRNRIRDETSSDVEKLHKEIQERIGEHNALQVQKFLEKVGLTDETLVNQVRLGEMNTGQAISSIAQAYKGLGQEKRIEALAKFKEERAKSQVHKESVRKNTMNIAPEMQKRAESRKQEAQGMIEQIRERVNANLKDKGIERLATGRGSSGIDSGNNSGYGNAGYDRRKDASPVSAPDSGSENNGGNRK
jgi:hypothetical protein